MGGLGVKVQHFPLTLLVVLTTLTLPCERDDAKIDEIGVTINLGLYLILGGRKWCFGL